MRKRISESPSGPQAWPATQAGYKTATWISAHGMLWESCKHGGVHIKQFYRESPQYRQATVTARDFEPGERVEVDYAGDTIEWFDLSTGENRKAYVFVADLGFSQLLFAWAAEDTRSRNWLTAHRRMFEVYGGVAHVTVVVAVWCQGAFKEAAEPSRASNPPW